MEKYEPSRLDLLVLSVLLFGGAASVLIGAAYLSWKMMTWPELCILWGLISVIFSFIYVAYRNSEEGK